MPPVATSTITASSISNGSAIPILRVAGVSEKEAPMADGDDTTAPPSIDVKEHDFFWTYTEEPHRSRRMAIIKAHPEVRLSSEHLYYPVNCTLQTNRQKLHAGHQALRARASHEIRCSPRRIHPNTLRLPLARYTILLMEVLPHSLHNWRHGNPKSLPRYPRNLPQPRFQKRQCQSCTRHIRQSSHRNPVFRFIQSMSPPYKQTEKLPEEPRANKLTKPNSPTT